MVPPLLFLAPFLALPGTSWLLLATHWLFLALFLALSLTLFLALSLAFPGSFPGPPSSWLSPGTY